MPGFQTGLLLVSIQITMERMWLASSAPVGIRGNSLHAHMREEGRAGQCVRSLGRRPRQIALHSLQSCGISWPFNGIVEDCDALVDISYLLLIIGYNNNPYVNS